MIAITRNDERGLTRIGWLDSRHTFSFGDYYEPERRGFRTLRVINEDRVRPGYGFDTHPHRDMEILSYVLDGALAHKDSMGNGSLIHRGDVQRMSAGTGVLHSEYNPSPDEPTHFLQIWLLPARRGLEPSYEQKHFTDEERRNRLRLVASPTGQDGAVKVHQDVLLYSGLLDEGAVIEKRLAAGRHAWLQVARGTIMLGGERLTAGDGAAVSEEEVLAIRALAPSEVLLFDLG
jgi:redox-sensitive bicupin YhaK (pirin superfamily)